MKLFRVIPMAVLLFLLTGCPEIRREDARTRLFKNNMDLPDPARRYHEDIRFELSELFEDSYNKEFVLKDDAMTKIIYELDLNFSVEAFDSLDAETIRFSFPDNTKLLDAVHDNYVYKRQKSLNKQFTSLKKPLPKSVGFPGYLQTIEGENYYDAKSLIYAMATVEIDKKYYVFQLIGLKDNMGYLYDDFLDILNSIER